MAIFSGKKMARHKVLTKRILTESTFILQIERKGIQFTPGQNVSVGPVGIIDMREYSIYSSVHDDYLEILVKEVEQGYVSPLLNRVAPGDEVSVDGPFGFFTLDGDKKDEELTFISTGTGISPFHSFVRSYPGLRYTLINGTRHERDTYELSEYDPQKLVRCISREKSSHYQGRVTAYLLDNVANSDGLYYLCGNCDMIYEVYDILADQGVSRDRIFAEVYF